MSSPANQSCMTADAQQADQQLEQRSRSVESVESRQMRHHSPARMSADAAPLVRNSPRLKVSKVLSGLSVLLCTHFAICAVSSSL